TDLREDRDHQDISFLSGETGRDPEQITALVTAHRLMASNRLDPEGLYGLFRRGLPRDLPALAAAGTARQRRALGEAIERAIISPLFRDRLEAFLTALAGQATDQPTSLLEPERLNAPVSTLDGIVVDRLNDRLRSAIVDAAGPVSPALAGALKAATLRLDYRPLSALRLD